MPDSSNHLNFRLEIPGLPEMEPMLREFASRAITLADVEGSRHDALLEALVSAVNLVEREIMDGGDDPVDLSIGVAIDAAAIAALGVRPVVAPSVMDTPERADALARTVAAGGAP